MCMVPCTCSFHSHIEVASSSSGATEGKIEVKEEVKCKSCVCSTYLAHPFKKNVCNNCFHKHAEEKSGVVVPLPKASDTRCNHSHCPFSTLLVYTYSTGDSYTRTLLATCLLLPPGAIIFYPLIPLPHWRLASSYLQLQALSLAPSLLV